MLNQNRSLPWRNFIHMFMLLYSISVVMTFNFATRGSITFKPPANSMGGRNSYFGYSVGLVNTNGTIWLIVGAPRGSSAGFEDGNESGVLYKCKVAHKDQECQEVILSTSREDNGQYVGWAGASIDVNSEGNAVVCAPRSRATFTTKTSATGICYILTPELKNMSNIKAFAISRYDGADRLWFKHRVNQYNYYIYGLVGMSAHFTSPNRFILGGPGIFELIGSIVEVVKRWYTNYSDWAPNPAYMKEISFSNYFGYSVTSGNFSSNKILYVAGAPRGSDLLGMVLVFKYGKDYIGQRVIHIKETKRGTQFGEYFGAAVGAADFDNNALSDLVVGAPLYTAGNSRESGRVYVFINKGGKLNAPGIELEGDQKQSARFGAAIGIPGDLDGDHYEDLLVGAPFEEPSGAVYIYNGYKDGIRKEYSQKLLPKEIFSVGSFHGFGSSFSRPMDVDGNHYPDIAVGSFLANKAAILFTRPVIALQGRMSSSPKRLSETDRKLQLEICSKYGGNEVPSTIEVVITVIIIAENLPTEAATFHTDGSNRYENIISLRNNKERCIKQVVDIQNIMKLPGKIRFTMEHSVYKGSDDNIIPIINPKKSAVDPIFVPFITGCEGGADPNECETILHLRVDTKDFPDRLPVGKIDALTLPIVVTNDGEPAFLPYVTIEVDEPLDFATSDHNCQRSTNKNKIILSCQLRNPLKTKDNIDIDLDLSALSDRSSDSNITIHLRSASEYEENSEDMHKMVSLKLQKNITLEVSGSFDPEQIEYEVLSENEIKSTDILQTELRSIVWKLGATPVTQIDIELLLPVAVKNNNGTILPLIKINSTQLYFNGQSQTCKSREVATPEMNIAYENFSRTLTAINCSSDIFRCEQVYCSVGPWKGRGEEGALEVKLSVNFTTLSRLMSVRNGAVITTEIRVVVANSTEPSKYITGIWEAKRNIEINFIPSELASSPFKWWSITIAIIGGILLIACLSYGLYKLGFFQRKKRDEMESKQSQLLEQEEPAAKD